MWNIIIGLPLHPIIIFPFADVTFCDGIWNISCFWLDVFNTITNGTAIDVDDDMTVRSISIILLKLTVEFAFRISEQGSNRGQASTTIDTSEYLTIIDVYLNVTTDGSGRLCIATEPTASAKHVTFRIRSTRCTNDNIRVRVISLANFDSATDVCLCIAEDMTILTSTEGRAIDASGSRDIDLSAGYVCPRVEVDTLVTLTGTEEITDYRMRQFLLIGTWYTHSTTRHVDGTTARHVGLLVTAIGTGQNVSACDIHHGITSYRTCCTEP